MKTRTKIILLPLTIAVSLCTPSQAANLMMDDFESYIVGGNLTTTGGTWSSASTGQITIRDESTQTPFGTPNQYLEWDDSDSSGVGARTVGYAAASNVVSTISFDFFERVVADRNDLIRVGYSIDGGDIISGNRRQAITFEDGVVGSVSGGTATYSQDTAYRVFMIFNDSAASVVYSDGTINAGDAHVWLRDLGTGINTFAGISTSENTATSETSYSLAFRANGNSDQQFVEIDNVSFDTGIVPIPEPSSTALLGLGGLALILSRRR